MEITSSVSAWPLTRVIRVSNYEDKTLLRPTLGTHTKKAEDYLHSGYFISNLLHNHRVFRQRANFNVKESFIHHQLFIKISAFLNIKRLLKDAFGNVETVSFQAFCRCIP